MSNPPRNDDPLVFATCLRCGKDLGLAQQTRGNFVYRWWTHILEWDHHVCGANPEPLEEREIGK